MAKDTIHRGSFWSWTGPSNWNGTYGKNGITVSSPSDTSVIDLGFASIFCTPGSSVQQSRNRFFDSQRAALAHNGVRFTRIGQPFIVQGLGTNYFREVSAIKFRIGRTRIKGQTSLDYQMADPTYCYQNSRVMYAPANGFKSRFRQLNRIYGSFAYFGPGASTPPREG